LRSVRDRATVPSREGRILTDDYREYSGKDHVVFEPAYMTPQQLRDGIRWLARSFFSPDRLARRVRLALANPRVLDAFPRPIRPAILVLLGSKQALHWHSLMTPSLHDLRGALEAVNKWRYPGAVLRGSNIGRAGMGRSGVLVPKPGSVDGSQTPGRRGAATRQMGLNNELRASRFRHHGRSAAMRARSLPYPYSAASTMTIAQPRDAGGRSR
jgi:hypothetical protein